MPIPESLELIRADLVAHAKSISALTDEVRQLKLESAVRDERDRAVRDHLARIEKALEGLYSLGRWAFFAFAGSLIAALVTFIVKGGLSVPAP